MVVAPDALCYPTNSVTVGKAGRHAPRRLKDASPTQVAIVIRSCGVLALEVDVLDHSVGMKQETFAKLLRVSRLHVVVGATIGSTGIYHATRRYKISLRG